MPAANTIYTSRKKVCAPRPGLYQLHHTPRQRLENLCLLISKMHFLRSLIGGSDAKLAISCPVSVARQLEFLRIQTRNESREQGAESTFNAFSIANETSQKHANRARMPSPSTENIYLNDSSEYLFVCNKPITRVRLFLQPSCSRRKKMNTLFQILPTTNCYSQFCTHKH